MMKKIEKFIEKCAKTAEAKSFHWSRFSQVCFMVILMTIIESNGSDKTSIFICHPARGEEEEQGRKCEQ